MHCNYCQATNLREIRHYKIENVRERFNPTYFHSQIFGNTQPVASKVRCTPTYHSQAFKIDGYGHNCKGKCVKKTEVIQKNTNVNVEARKTNKNGDFTNNRGKSCYNGRVKWYDQQKNEKFNHIQSTYDYSRERKYADLASSSVFDGYVYQTPCVQNELCNCVNCQCVNCQCGKTKIGDIQVKNCPPGCSCINCTCVNCQCGQQAEVKSCLCVNCQCVDCNCKSGCCQKKVQPKPVIVQNDKAKEQVTFGKKRATKIQKGFSQPKKVIKEKPTFTVIRQR